LVDPATSTEYWMNPGLRTGELLVTTPY
jgi:hypothetical protein